MKGVQAQRDFVDKLIAALDHPEPETRALAAMILGWRGEKRGVDPLLHVVLREDDAYLVEAAVEALGRIGDPRCRPALQAAASRGQLHVRHAALRALVSLETSPEDSNE